MRAMQIIRMHFYAEIHPRACALLPPVGGAHLPARDGVGAVAHTPQRGLHVLEKILELRLARTHLRPARTHTPKMQAAQQGRR